MSKTSICPNCQNELKPNARFCTKCGCNIAEMGTNAQAPVSMPETKSVCPNCGGELKPNAKFCTKCGCNLTEEAAVKIQAATSAPRVKYATADNTAKQPKPHKASKTMKQPKPEKEWKGLGGLIVFFVILALLIITVAAVAVLMLNDIIPAPAFIAGTSVEESENIETETEIVEETLVDNETSMDETDSEINVDELFADVDSSVETAKGKLGDASESVNVMNELSAAINDYVAKAEEAGDLTIASDRVTAAYTAYAQAVEAHKELMDASSLSGAIYVQVMMELEEAIVLGDELTSKGYSVDTSALVLSKDTFDSSYTQRIIDTFDELTTRDAWSRTEAWNLMKDTADNMFDSSEDLDDSIRLRYTYALAWWIQKQIETELADGTITEKGAAIKIANLIEDMDYNLMMVDYYIQYMNAAGEDCSSVKTAYDEVVSHVSETQGLYIGSDIDLAHFWSFNDVDNPSSGVQDGTWNGLTQENREWIRTRMANASFAEG